MSKTVRRRFFVLIWGIAIITTLASLWAIFSRNQNLIHQLLSLLLFIIVGILATLIFDRQPRNPVGWSFLAVFLNVNLSSLFRILVQWYLSGSLQIPFLSARFLGFVDAYLDGPVSVVLWGTLFLFPILYFPDGELLSPRWRYMVWSISILFIVLLTSGIFLPDLEAPLFPDFRNPYSHLLGKQVWEVANFSFLPLMILTPLSLVFRFRKAGVIERQQIKWPLFSALIIFISIILYVLDGVLYNNLENRPIFQVALVFEQISVMSFPITTGLAILRYRLYDIDIIIRKTIQYTLVSGVLVLIYFGIVTQLGTLFHIITGQDSPLAIVISTLAIAALFNPLRRRIQIFIDRRFFRQKYDAEQVLAEFSATLRDEFDLDKLSNSILRVVDETVQPSKLSLWMRNEEE